MLFSTVFLCPKDDEFDCQAMDKFDAQHALEIKVRVDAQLCKHGD